MPQRTHKYCPYCGEMIKAAAVKCRFCDEIIDPAIYESAQQEVRSPASTIADNTQKPEDQQRRQPSSAITASKETSKDIEDEEDIDKPPRDPKILVVLIGGALVVIGVVIALLVNGRREQPMVPKSPALSPAATITRPPPDLTLALSRDLRLVSSETALAIPSDIASAKPMPAPTPAAEDQPMAAAPPEAEKPAVPEKKSSVSRQSSSANIAKPQKAIAVLSAQKPSQKSDKTETINSEKPLSPTKSKIAGKEPGKQTPLVAGSPSGSSVAAESTPTIKKPPSSPVLKKQYDALIVLSQQALKLNQLDKAIEKALEAKRLNPEDPVAFKLLAELFSNKGNKELARRYQREYVRLTTGSAP